MSILKSFEMQESVWVVPRAFHGITLYTEPSGPGFLGLFPMDILHTVSKGIVELLTAICDGYMEQSSKIKKGKRKNRSKSARRQGISTFKYALGVF